MDKKKARRNRRVSEPGQQARVAYSFFTHRSPRTYTLAPGPDRRTVPLPTFPAKPRNGAEPARFRAFRGAL
jgi:hypothetical protein